mmetsp:Transcript_4147/g.12291  ORF Transcript_4147/g.12291 Transcript_4147/m.12291 type:complete len:360 (+) Transcript_4147:69-1148(+)
MGDTAVALAVQRLLARHNGATSPDALADAASWAARAHHARAALSQLASDGSPLIPATMREALAADATTELDDLVARVTAWLTQSPWELGKCRTVLGAVSATASAIGTWLEMAESVRQLESDVLCALEAIAATGIGRAKFALVRASASAALGDTVDYTELQEMAERTLRELLPASLAAQSVKIRSIGCHAVRITAQAKRASSVWEGHPLGPRASGGCAAGASEQRCLAMAVHAAAARVTELAAAIREKRWMERESVRREHRRAWRQLHSYSHGDQCEAALALDSLSRSLALSHSLEDFEVRRRRTLALTFSRRYRAVRSGCVAPACDRLDVKRAARRGQRRRCRLEQRAIARARALKYAV